MNERAIPGVGPVLSALVPVTCLQVVTVVGADAAATTSQVTCWERSDAGGEWRRVGPAVPGRNGTAGWSTDHHKGEASSPVGVFSLTAAGGRLPDPGTLLPYEYRPSYYQSGGFGAGLAADAFDHVIAVDYNRIPGYPPSDPTRPDGEVAGGDIWLHVGDSPSATGGVALPEAALAAILGWLSPTCRPVIVMGDAATLAA